MDVNIWSDVRCPFCYIGKRKFEMALDKFPHKDKIKTIWRSFELDPYIQTEPGKTSVDHLSEAKGITKNQAEDMEQHVAQIAQEVGLPFNLKKSVVANSYNAHRLIQMAKTKNLGNEIEEQLFKAHFVEGKNIDDKEILVHIGVSTGLEETEIREMLNSDAFSKEVRHDEMEAQSIGVRGVPFFVLNNKYAVSGAQSPEVFLDVLNQTWKEFEEEKKKLIITEGPSCSVDGNCN